MDYQIQLLMKNNVMKNYWPGIVKVSLVLLQLPFTFVGLSIVFGIVRDGADHFRIAYYAAVAAGL